MEKTTDKNKISDFLLYTALFLVVAGFTLLALSYYIGLKDQHIQAALSTGATVVFIISTALSFSSAAIFRAKNRSDKNGK